jgi:tRNA 5-methylaminomethyl-2-thiouridine biosynthesis bifunctional protein
MQMPPKTAIVIGGGIAGCSTAFALAQRGIKVTLLERHAEIASEASGNPIGMLYPRLSGDDAASEFTLAGFLHSLALFKSLDLDPKNFNYCGLLQLGFNARELLRITKVARQNHPANILKYVTQLEASSLAGTSISHDALYFPNAGWVKPQQLCKRLRQHKNISLTTSTNALNIL